MHRKTTNPGTIFGRYLSALVVMLMLSVFVIPQKSHAFLSWSWIKDKVNALPELCNPEQELFKNIALDQPQQSIIRFGYNYDTVRYLKVFYNIFGVSPSGAIRCISTIPLTDFSAIGAVCTAVTGAPATGNCANFVLGYNNDSNKSGKFALGSGDGSLLGFYTVLDSSLGNLGNPADLNYFASRSLEKVPFVGKALAADPQVYGAPLVPNVYGAWKMVRNLSLGVFAFMLLIVGIMMINRTRINPQTVVTIQYALPKIIISIILILFSYPIGALFTTIAWYGRAAVVGVVTSEGLKVVSSDIQAKYIDPATGHVKVGVILVQVLMSMIGMLGPGLFAIILALILVIIMLVQLIIILVKTAIYYVKMIFEIVLAPVSFVYSAIPGNDEALMAWFKKMLAYALSLIVLSALPFLSLLIALDVALSLTPDVGSGTATYGLSFLYSMSMYPLLAGAIISYVGLSMTLKLPAQIEETLTGKKKGR